MDYRIINYNESYREKLLGYLLKIAPYFSKEYADYCIAQAESNPIALSSIIVVDDNENIVGCHFVFGTKVMIDGEEKEVGWGHDTYLDVEVRRNMGLDFVLAINKIPGFGIGLTRVNSALHHKMKSIFFENLNNYVYPVITLPTSFFHRRKALAKKEIISINNHSFRHVTEASAIHYLNQGYWFKNSKDIDFVRDEAFMSSRFFNNPVFKYTVYQLDDAYCYFVVRPVLFKGIPTCLLVDFRYDPTHLEQIELIFKAVNKIAVKSNLGLVLVMNNDEHVATYLMKNKLMRKKSIEFVTGKSKNITAKSTSFVTSADADVDFHR